MSVKRYSLTFSGALVVSQNGGMVDYEDYAALEARCAALAAENAGLKDEISNITFMRDDDFFGSTQRAQEVMGRLVNVKTPATDAFLAEVRASGVEMFGQYHNFSEKLFIQKEAQKFAAQLRKGVQS
ncbi:hypothetical protein LMA44_17720 [Enterobacter hormaechei]|uniref:hypothetical protein n=1 Tax=Enterobacter hormaechei TaxID=158836 RepID=UPI001E364971|nr:hypothetical protein [Enterobacter hormaechei]MCC4519010.1 hypothetical protein [Enterobacter hormaechei]MCC4543829.1 hypothetical protein [Enterobacter hormaechei]MCC4550408.1 hypothetical protein [Enterobacter hormaechei]